MALVRNFECMECGKSRQIHVDEDGNLSVDPAGAKIILGEPEDETGKREPISIGCHGCIYELLEEQKRRLSRR